MSRRLEINKPFGDLVRRYANEHKSQKALASKLGIGDRQFRRIKSGVVPAAVSMIELLKSVLGIPTEEMNKALSAGYSSQSGLEKNVPAPVYGENPKPIRIADICLTNVFRMVGNDTEPLELGVQYNNADLKLDRKIQPHYLGLSQKAADDALKHDYVYFPDGPCARLLRIIPKSRQGKSGREEHGYVLDLGPVSWEQYTVLNELLLKDKAHRQKFADTESLYHHGYDLRWCALSNLLTVTMTPITSDGFGLVGLRSRHGVSSAFRVLTPAVNENIHRFLDEAPQADLAYRLHSIERDKTPSEVVWNRSTPVGVPSPLLTAQRGVFEELSPELHRFTIQNPSSYKFLNILFEFDYFHPYLTGVIELGMDRNKVKKIIEEYPPAHPEYLVTEFLSLEKSSATTLKRISEQSRWGSWGLAAFISAMHYWEYTEN